MYITRISRVAHNSKQVISNNEETPVTSLFRGSSEEFSYENVNLYKGNCVERIVGMYSLYSIQPCGYSIRKKYVLSVTIFEKIYKNPYFCFYILFINTILST